MQKFLPSGGKPPTIKDLENLAPFSPVVKSLWTLHEKGDLTWDEFLISSCLALADMYHSAMEMAMEASVKQRTVYLTTVPPTTGG